MDTSSPLVDTSPVIQETTIPYVNYIDYSNSNNQGTNNNSTSQENNNYNAQYEQVPRPTENPSEVQENNSVTPPNTESVQSNLNLHFSEQTPSDVVLDYNDFMNYNSQQYNTNPNVVEGYEVKSSEIIYDN